jgi:nitrous oxidase accessory protein NosD
MPRTASTSAKNLLTSTAVMLLLLAAASACAASFQTFVSVNGNDANTSASCVRAKPCRLIKTALTVTSPGGALTVLDSGGFGGFTVTQSVQVVTAPGVQATIVPISPNTSTAVTVNAPDAHVTLRGLHLASPGPGDQTGIQMDGARALHVENCVVAGFAGGGILVKQFTPALSATEVFVSDTVIRECDFGVLVRGDADNSLRPIRAVLERVRVEDCTGVGLYFVNNVDAAVRDSVSSGNETGVFAQNSIADQKTEVMVENCLVTGSNFVGILALGEEGGTAVLDVEGTTVAFNETGLHALGDSFINSRKDNTLRRNVENGTFSTIFTPQ